ncbi:MAG: hypothetical protein HC857_08600 [Synechococcales cyanobacterium RU_4_20]|nr:hypothetical protein [Synechococcales cyanobacterium RU_4_20]
MGLPNGRQGGGGVEAKAIANVEQFDGGAALMRLLRQTGEVGGDRKFFDRLAPSALLAVEGFVEGCGKKVKEPSWVGCGIQSVMGLSVPGFIRVTRESQVTHK